MGRRVGVNERMCLQLDGTKLEEKQELLFESEYTQALVEAMEVLFFLSI